jgi:hypothetical protein
MLEINSEDGNTIPASKTHILSYAVRSVTSAKLISMVTLLSKLNDANIMIYSCAINELPPQYLWLQTGDQRLSNSGSSGVTRDI